MHRALIPALGLLGCSVYDPSLLRDGGTRQDGGVDSCESGSRRPPSRPTTADGPDGPEIIFALKDPLLDQGEGWRTIGLNLDGLCSVAPEPVVECVPPRPTAMPPLDGEDGIDNVFGAQILPLLALAYPELPMIATESADAGLGAIILRIRGWNGQDDDPRVEVAIAQTVDGVAGTAAETMPPDVGFVMFEAQNASGDPAPAPRWDGNDWFWLRDDNFLSGGVEEPRVFDNNAYVAGRTLVVQLPARAEIVFSGGENGVRARLTDPFFLGDISADRTRIGPVTAAGRWSIVDLLDTARSVGVCDGSSELRLFMNQLDTIADVRSTPGSGGEGVTCDAVSLGMTFQGYRGRIGGLTEGAALPDRCP